MEGQDNTASARTWRPGGISMIHVAFGFSVLASALMAVLTLGI